MNRFLLFALAATVIMAGCASNDAEPSDGTTTTPAPTPARQVTKEEAGQLFDAATSGLPSRYGYAFTASKGGTELLTAQGLFDNTTKDTYTSVRGDPASFGGMGFIAEGLSILTTTHGAAYVFGDLALVQAAASNELEGIIPAGVGLFSPQDLIEGVRDNITINDVRATTYKGRPAIEVGFSTVDDDGTASGKAMLWQAPTRLAHVEVTTPTSEDKNDIFAGAVITIDILYDGDAPSIPASLGRALGLGYEPGVPSQRGDQAWTFIQDGGIPLSEVEVRVQDKRGADTISEAKVVLSMPLEAGTASADGFTAVFDDADGDGMLSAGDKLTVTASDDAAFVPRIVLFDETTSQHVTSDMLVVLSLLFGF